MNLEKIFAEQDARALKERKRSRCTFTDLSPGTPVVVVTDGYDFHFFNRDTGRVAYHSGKHVIVRFDVPRRYQGDSHCAAWTMYEFNFKPEHLKVRRRIPARRSDAA